jgi:hypothetical protein
VLQKPDRKLGYVRLHVDEVARNKKVKDTWALRETQKGDIEMTLQVAPGPATTCLPAHLSVFCLAPGPAATCPPVHALTCKQQNLVAGVHGPVMGRSSDVNGPLPMLRLPLHVCTSGAPLSSFARFVLGVICSDAMAVVCFLLESWC